jgi:hypothetical protein
MLIYFPFIEKLFHLIYWNIDLELYVKKKIHLSSMFLNLEPYILIENLNLK